MGLGVATRPSEGSRGAVSLSPGSEAGEGTVFNCTGMVLSGCRLPTAASAKGATASRPNFVRPLVGLRRARRAQGGLEALLLPCRSTTDGSCRPTGSRKS